jgi:hypothetical protein
MTLGKRGIIVGVSLLILAQFTPAQTKASLPSKDQAKALFDKAFDGTNLRSQGAPPFHLRVKAKSYGLKDQAVEGTYELWWSSEDRWREEVSWGGPPIVTIASNNRLSISAQDSHLRDTLFVAGVLKFWPTFYLPDIKGIVQMKVGDLGGSPLVCVRDYARPIPGATVSIPVNIYLQNIFPQQNICFDLGTGDPVEIESRDTRWTYGEFKNLGSKRFPHQMHVAENKKKLIDVEVELLEPFDISNFETFIPPSAAISNAWCSMRPPMPVYFGSTRPELNQGFREEHGVPPPFPEGFEDYGMIVFSVDEGGKTLDVRAFHPGGEFDMKDSQKSLLAKSTFKPATCSGKPVKDEYIVWR